MILNFFPLFFFFILWFLLKVNLYFLTFNEVLFNEARFKGSQIKEVHLYLFSIPFGPKNEIANLKYYLQFLTHFIINLSIRQLKFMITEGNSLNYIYNGSAFILRSRFVY